MDLIRDSLVLNLWETGKKRFSNNIVNRSCLGEDSATGLTQAGHLMVQLLHPDDILETAFFTFCLLLMIKQNISSSQNRKEKHSSKYRDYADSRIPNATSLFSANAVRHLKNRSQSSQEFSFLCKRLAIAVWLTVWESLL